MSTNTHTPDDFLRQLTEHEAELEARRQKLVAENAFDDAAQQRYADLRRQVEEARTVLATNKAKAFRQQQYGGSWANRPEEWPGAGTPSPYQFGAAYGRNAPHPLKAYAQHGVRRAVEGAGSALSEIAQWTVDAERRQASQRLWRNLDPDFMSDDPVRRERALQAEMQKATLLPSSRSEAARTGMGGLGKRMTESVSGLHEETGLLADLVGAAGSIIPPIATALATRSPTATAAVAGAMEGQGDYEAAIQAYSMREAASRLGLNPDGDLSEEDRVRVELARQHLMKDSAFRSAVEEKARDPALRSAAVAAGLTFLTPAGRAPRIVKGGLAAGRGGLRPALGYVGKEFLKGGAGEAVEEGLHKAYTGYDAKLIAKYDPERTQTQIWKEAGYEAALGFVTGGLFDVVLGGGGTVVAPPEIGGPPAVIGGGPGAGPRTPAGLLPGGAPHPAAPDASITASRVAQQEEDFAQLVVKMGQRRWKQLYELFRRDQPYDPRGPGRDFVEPTPEALASMASRVLHRLRGFQGQPRLAIEAEVRRADDILRATKDPTGRLAAELYRAGLEKLHQQARAGEDAVRRGQPLQLAPVRARAEARAAEVAEVEAQAAIDEAEAALAQFQDSPDQLASTLATWEATSTRLKAKGRTNLARRLDEAVKRGREMIATLVQQATQAREQARVQAGAEEEQAAAQQAVAQQQQALAVRQASTTVRKALRGKGAEQKLSSLVDTLSQFPPEVQAALMEQPYTPSSTFGALLQKLQAQAETDSQVEEAERAAKVIAAARKLQEAQGAEAQGRGRGRGGEAVRGGDQRGVRRGRGKAAAPAEEVPRPAVPEAGQAAAPEAGEGVAAAEPKWPTFRQRMLRFWSGKDATEPSAMSREQKTDMLALTAPDVPTAEMSDAEIDALIEEDIAADEQDYRRIEAEGITGGASFTGQQRRMRQAVADGKAVPKAVLDEAVAIRPDLLEKLPKTTAAKKAVRSVPEVARAPGAASDFELREIMKQLGISTAGAMVDRVARLNAVASFLRRPGSWPTTRAKLQARLKALDLKLSGGNNQGLTELRSALTALAAQVTGKEAPAEAAAAPAVEEAPAPAPKKKRPQRKPKGPPGGVEQMDLGQAEWAPVEPGEEGPAFRAKETAEEGGAEETPGPRPEPEKPTDYREAARVPFGRYFYLKGHRDFTSWTRKMTRELGKSWTRLSLEARQGIYRQSVALAQEDLAKLPKLRKGRLAGAPQKKHNLMAFLRQALGGIAGRFWYQESAEGMVERFGENAQRFLKFLAVTSPGAEVRANSALAVNAFAQALMRPFTTIGKNEPLGIQGAKPSVLKMANDLARTGEWSLSAEKTQSFYKNLAHDLGFTNSLGREVTVDMWMMRALGYNTDAPTEQQYAHATLIIQAVADTLGWQPREVQAAIWCEAKLRATKKAHRWIGNYADALAMQDRLLNWEVTPGKNVETNGWLRDADYQTRERVAQFAREKVMPAILDALGLTPMAASIEVVPGGYKLVTNPALTTKLPLPTWAADALASAVGFVFRQDAVLVARLGAVGKTDFQVIRWPKGTLTAATAQRFFEHAAGRTEGLSGGYLVIGDDMVFLNLLKGDAALAEAEATKGKKLTAGEARWSGLPPVAFKKALSEAAESFPDDIDLQFHEPGHSTDAHYVTNDWTESTDGQGYLSQVESVRPGVEDGLRRAQQLFDGEVARHRAEAGERAAAAEPAAEPAAGERAAPEARGPPGEVTEEGPKQRAKPAEERGERFGPGERLSPADIKQLRRIVADLLGARFVDVVFPETVGGGEALGSFWRGIIEIALEQNLASAQSTVVHEAFHGFMKLLKKANPQAWQAVIDHYAPQVKGGETMTEAKLVSEAEELAAEEAKERWHELRSIENSRVRSVLQKFRQLVQRIKGWLGKKKVTSPDDIVRRFAAGEYRALAEEESVQVQAGKRKLRRVSPRAQLEQLAGDVPLDDAGNAALDAMVEADMPLPWEALREDVPHLSQRQHRAALLEAASRAHADLVQSVGQEVADARMDETYAPYLDEARVPTEAPVYRKKPQPDPGATFTTPEQGTLDWWDMKFVDASQYLRRVQKAIVAAGGRITESANAYLKEEVWSSKASSDINRAGRTLYRRLFKEMAGLGVKHFWYDIQTGERRTVTLKERLRMTDEAVRQAAAAPAASRTGKAVAVGKAALKTTAQRMAEQGFYRTNDLALFLYARHAPERNRVIAARNVAFPDGGSGMTNAQAQAIMDHYRNTGQLAELRRLAQMVDDIIASTNAVRLAYGLETQETIDAWTGLYRHYVPLQGFAADENADGKVSRTGEGQGVYGPESYIAKGRSSVAGDPLSNVIRQHNEAMVRGRKNEFANALFELALQFRNSEVWEIFSDDHGLPEMYTKERDRLLKLGMNRTSAKATARGVYNAWAASNNKPALTEADDHGETHRVLRVWYVDPDTGTKHAQPKTFWRDPTTGKVSGSAQPGYVRVTRRRTLEVKLEEKAVSPFGRDMSDFVSVKRGGRQYFIGLKQEAMREAWRTMGHSDLGMALSVMRMSSRWVSAMATSYFPEFMLTNPIRDSLMGLASLYVETGAGGVAEGKKFTKVAMRDIPRGMKTMFSMLRGKDIADPTWKLHSQWFEQDGVQAGWYHAPTLVEQMSQTEREVRRASGSKMAKVENAGVAAMEAVETMNAAIENGIRLSVYSHAIRSGLSRQQAATLAKNLTVNFTRKGTAGAKLQAAYVFANPSIQGSRVTWRIISTKRGQQTAAALMSQGVLLAFLAMAMSDDDEDGRSFYSKIPDHVKARNIVIMKLWGEDAGEDYYKFPLPYGLSFFYNIGTAVADVLGEQRSAGDAGLFLGDAFLGNFMPIGLSKGSSFWRTAFKSAMPTALRPAAELGFNENWYGGPITPADYGEGKPAWARGYQSTPQVYWTAARVISALTPGDVSPESVEFLTDFVAGGFGRFVTNVFQSAIAAFDPAAEQPLYRTPFVRRFYGEPNPLVDSASFYQRGDVIKQKQWQLEQYEARDLDDKASRYEQENGEYLDLLRDWKVSEKRLKELRKEMRAVHDEDPDTLQGRKDQAAELERLEDEIRSEYMAFNKTWNENIDPLE